MTEYRDGLKPLHAKVGRALRVARLAANRTQAEAAAVINVSRIMYNGREMGRMRVSLAEAIVLCEYFGVGVGSLMVLIRADNGRPKVQRKHEKKER